MYLSARRHFCRYGTQRREQPAATYAELLGQPTEYRHDDGKIIVAAVLEGWGGQLVCADCETGHLRWARGGFAVWHRICDICGSHWDLHSISWCVAHASGQNRCAKSFGEPVSSSLWLEGPGLIPGEPLEAMQSYPGKSSNDLLQSFGDRMWGTCGLVVRRRSAAQDPSSGCWARRARFYAPH